MKRMLINATQEEELRVAMVDGQRLYDLNIELASAERKKANIYKGKITRIEPSLEAAFVNYGADRHGFLPLKEISEEYFVAEVKPGSKVNIKDVLREGQDIVVQIDKEERGNKGAALTTFVSLAGRFIVLKPNKAKSGGVSRRIVGEDRDLARSSLNEVAIPDGMSVILRTAGIDRTAEELEWDLNNLLAIWEAIKSVVVSRPSPFLIYRESNAVIRALRDYLSNEIGEILVDDEKAYEGAREFVEQVMPHNLRKLKLYTDPVPLFTRYQIETQIESAFAHTVHLPSGGSIVIDHTEALVSIDINSARATKGGDIEATALQTNLEAAEEVARQLRLRDLGGLVVIDFIDMGPQKNQRDVESRLRDAVRQDRARVQIGKISRFGLLEMSRQRLRPSLGESNYLTCPRCSGIGNIRSVESLALAILRIIGEEVRKERTAKVIAQLPVEVATYLLNEKRDWVQSLESRHDTHVILVANPGLETPHYKIRRVRDDQVELPENVGTSYTLAETDEEQLIPQAIQSEKPVELAAVATVVATTPAPPRKVEAVEKGPGLWARFMSLFSSEETSEPDGKKRQAGRKSQKKDDGRDRGGKRSRQRGDAQKSEGGQKGGRGRQTDQARSRKAEGAGAAKKPRRQKSDERVAEKVAEDADARPQRAEGAEEARSEGRPAGAKRRSRGGRRRRRSSPDSAEQTSASSEQAQAGQTDASQPDAGRTDTPDAAPKAPRQRRSRAAEKPVDAEQASDRAEEQTAMADVAATAAVTAAAGVTAVTETPASQADEWSEPRPEPARATAIAPPTAEPAAAEPTAEYEDTQPVLPILTMDGETATEADVPAVQEPDAPTAAVPEAPKAAAPEAPKTAVPEAPEAVAPEAPKPAEPAAPKAAEPGASKAIEPEAGDDEAQLEAAINGGNGEAPASAAGEEKPATETAAEKKPKPEGRLLPWEPQPVAAAEPVQEKDAS